ELHAHAELQERLRTSPVIKVRYRTQLHAILGTDRVEGVRIADQAGGAEEELVVQGVFVRAAMEPATQPFGDVIDLDGDGYVIANEQRETSAQWVLACGDVRAGATKSVQAAIADGERAAARAAKMLGELEQG
ncbi:MAG TPA: NAD(P)/FAD-dependent oxidoreductase, partial [Chloroflexota bacterium]|nr:NAD(P)/FAD-dependent oxidoreductase [Chloroflexota bacterium]